MGCSSKAPCFNFFTGITTEVRDREADKLQNNTRTSNPTSFRMYASSPRYSGNRGPRMDVEGLVQSSTECSRGGGGSVLWVNRAEPGNNSKWIHSMAR